MEKNNKGIKCIFCGNRFINGKCKCGAILKIENYKGIKSKIWRKKLN